ncbi:MAG TPA: hypothetical protein VFW65_30040 [Pseudonocardiaceae bacterium]|nr:hypothetical protein [Pseudonocardiaceae bacterium]
MNSVTDGDTEDLGTGYLRRPISVAQLLEREGYRPTVRSRTARRALSGVAAGAVLTLGAVVGSLFLNHGQRTTGDLAAAGMAQSGGDIVLAESNTPPGSAPAATHATAVTTPASTSRTATTHHQATQKTATTPRTTHQDDHPQTTHQNPSTQQQQQQPTTQPQQPTATTQSAPTATTQLTQNTSTSTSTPAPTTQPTTTTTQPTTQPPTTQPTTTTQTPPPDNGLIGGVGQVLGSVTQPVFDWFN